MSPDRVDLKPNIGGLEIPRDKKGGIRWRLKGNSDEANLQLAITNIRLIFLARYPEFDVRFPLGEDEKIVQDKRDAARRFITEEIGTRAKFKKIFGPYPIGNLPIFKHSVGIALTQTFTPWGIDFDPPQGWRSTKSLVEETGKDKENVRSAANRFRQDNSEGFELYRHEQRIIQFYSPKVSHLIHQEVSRNVLPPKSWERPKRIAYKLRRSLETIQELAEEFRQDHPDWFRTIRQQGGPRTYYSPELEEGIKKKLEQTASTNLMPSEEANEQLRRLVEAK